MQIRIGIRNYTDALPLSILYLTLHRITSGFGGKVMRKRTPLLDWKIVEKQEEWEAALLSSAADLVSSAPIAYPRPYRRYLWGGLLALLLLLAVVGDWLWQKAQAGLEQIEGELSSTVQIELAAVALISEPPATTTTITAAAMAWGLQLKREQEKLPVLLSLDSPATQLITDVYTINLEGDLAVVTFVTTAENGAQAYRQTRFYRQTTEGWQRTSPNASMWGAPRRLESEYFIFNYRQNDVEVVAAVAPQLDVLYAKLLHNFGLTPDAEKLVIDVRVEQVTGAIVAPLWRSQPMVVPSPALYFAPIEMSEETLLVQSIALPLIEYVGARTIKAHSIPDHGQHLLRSVGLWQLWDLEMPLAQWRQEIVRWLYRDGSTDDPGKLSVPEHYAELCAMHSLWILSPMSVGIPLDCSISPKGQWVATRGSAHLPGTPLQRLRTPFVGYDDYSYYYETSDVGHATEEVEAATMIEYAVTTYGYEQLSVLLASLAQHDSWETLIPAVYGVSPSEFEQGWQAYMATEYGVQP